MCRCVVFLCVWGCVASHSPLMLDPELSVDELSEDEWTELCRWVNSRRPRGPRECLVGGVDMGTGSFELLWRTLDPHPDFCELRDAVELETVGALRDLVECELDWRARWEAELERRRYDYPCFRGTPCGDPVSCRMAPTVFWDGHGECEEVTP